ncbi:transposase [Streptomyces sp. 1222.5]|uniref:transposase n=1 Tax=Streptomyces sp. 1222.5 TaxID=1881026 RepID=UPI003D72D155
MAPDHLWELFQHVVSTAPDRAGKAASRRLGDREVLAASVFVSTSGCGWQSLPSGFGLSGQTAFRRFTDWSEARVWTELQQLLSDATEEQGDLDWSRRAINAVSTRANKRERGRRCISAPAVRAGRQLSVAARSPSLGWTSPEGRGTDRTGLRREVSF